ncbi:glycoside hydrolase family 88 protein [Variovorax sp. J22P168]|uniref:glycoside hydrolase family 88 protein n=1 Tax=Variovorax jilinensis TaxID=3053513 RepID=UPI002578655A|nr:glycoside hydrolase family 88 protein [Variovorax sp. J22P168]MDM0014915.1 glycoside hydrolase family 88 protein [Variovorax sp. J22P168]
MRTIDVAAAKRRAMKYVLTHPYERDYWEKAMAITSVLAWDDAEEVAEIRNWIDRAVETQTSNGDLNYADPLDLPAGHVRTFTPTSSLPCSLGYPLLLMHQRTGDASYLEAARLQAEALVRTSRTSEGGIWARKEGPELWVDFLYMMCPFLILYGQISGETSYVDEAFKQYDVHVRHLVDPHQGLTRHAWCETPNHYPQSTFWARGNGWLVCVSMDMLALAPDHKGAAQVREVGVRALKKMAEYQDRSGYFHHVLDDVGTKLEASSTVMFALAAQNAVQRDLVDSTFTDKALRAVRVVAASVDESGAVPGVAVPPGGPGVPFGTTLFGQGFFLLAAHALKQQLNVL